MKKKNGVSCTLLLGVVIADFHMYQCPKHEIDSSLTLLNIEILALAEDTGTGEWIRTDGDCTYEVQGAVGSEVSILGMKIKVGADGYARYTQSGGKTHCEIGGKEQCTARYCESIR